MNMRQTVVGISVALSLVSGVFVVASSVFAATVPVVVAPEHVVVVGKTSTAVTLMWGAGMRSIQSDVFPEGVAPVPYTRFSVKVVEKKTGKVVKKFYTRRNIVKVDDLRANTAYRVRIVAQREGIKSAPITFYMRTAVSK